MALKSSMSSHIQTNLLLLSSQAKSKITAAIAKTKKTTNEFTCQGIATVDGDSGNRPGLHPVMIPVN